MLEAIAEAEVEHICAEDEAFRIALLERCGVSLEAAGKL